MSLFTILIHRLAKGKDIAKPLATVTFMSAMMFEEFSNLKKKPNAIRDRSKTSPWQKEWFSEEFIKKAGKALNKTSGNR